MDDQADLDLQSARRLCAAATPGPWQMVTVNDAWASVMIAVATDPAVEGTSANAGTLDPGLLVAATFVQAPERYVDPDDDRADENAAFIAASRELVPRLIETVEALVAG